MDAKELRIGNYVNLLDNEVSVKGILWNPERDNMVLIQTDEFLDSKIIHIKPIPLTEQWLLDFGFEKIIWTYQIDVLPFKKEYKKLVVDLNQGILIRNGELKNQRVEDDLITLRNFDVLKQPYVHQLQNLYFALTGKELVKSNRVTEKEFMEALKNTDELI